MAYIEHICMGNAEFCSSCKKLTDRTDYRPTY